jgi:hypothetical protein
MTGHMLLLNVVIKEQLGFWRARFLGRATAEIFYFSEEKLAGDARRDTTPELLDEAPDAVVGALVKE